MHGCEKSTTGQCYWPGLRLQAFWRMRDPGRFAVTPHCKRSPYAHVWRAYPAVGLRMPWCADLLGVLLQAIALGGGGRLILGLGEG